MTRTDPFARNLIYQEFPKYYKWDRPHRQWVRRTSQIDSQSSLECLPSNGECYYMRQLLNHLKGVIAAPSKIVCQRVTNTWDHHVFICLP